jgi:hypothetical protein
MIGWTVQWTVISLVLIILLHYLYSFFIDTLTVPKVKDLIHNPTERYNQIVTHASNDNNNNISPTPDVSKMNEELRDFLSNIKKGSQESSMTPVSAVVETSAYSTY